MINAVLIYICHALLNKQKGEADEGVWQAALGCLLQLTTHGGYFVSAWVRHMPLQALAGLLRACITFNW